LNAAGRFCAISVGYKTVAIADGSRKLCGKPRGLIRNGSKA